MIYFFNEEKKTFHTDRQRNLPLFIIESHQKKQAIFGTYRNKQYLCEKYRNEKYRNMENPFKFGTLVDNEYFTDRVMEQQHISSMLDSPNHIVLISPRRFGKSSLVKRVVKKSGRPFISLNMQQVTCVEDLAAMILKGVFKLHPWEKLKHLLANFRVIPTISTTPLGKCRQPNYRNA